MSYRRGGVRGQGERQPCWLPVRSVDPGSGSPVFTDGPFVETKEHLGGFAVVDVPDDAQARYWAGRIAVAVGWPQEVHRFPHRISSRAGSQSTA